jgi:HAMP domain-containing protein
MALLASLSIGMAYAATETERLNVRTDSSTVAALYDQVVGLSNAIRDQEAAVDDYLLSGSSVAVVRYTNALDDELRLAEQMRIGAAQHPDIEAALETLTKEAGAWRASFAQPLIAAVERGSKGDISTIAATAATDQAPALTGVDALVARIADAETSVTARDDVVTRTRAAAGALGIVLMLLAAAASLVLARRWVTRPLGRLLATAREVEAGADVAFVTERSDEIGRLGQALERMRSALQLDVDRSGILNRFTEVTTFAPDDAAVAAANLEALRLLVQPDAAVTHVLNRSKDRAIPEATIGSAIAEVLPLNALSRCPRDRAREHLRDARCGRAPERPLSGLPSRPRNAGLRAARPRGDRRRRASLLGAPECLWPGTAGNRRPGGRACGPGDRQPPPPRGAPGHGQHGCADRSGQYPGI